MGNVLCLCPENYALEIGMNVLAKLTIDIFIFAMLLYICIVYQHTPCPGPGVHGMSTNFRHTYMNAAGYNDMIETKNFLTKITNDLVMATPIDSRKSRQTRNAINQPQSHPIEKCRI